MYIYTDMYNNVKYKAVERVKRYIVESGIHTDVASGGIRTSGI